MKYVVSIFQAKLESNEINQIVLEKRFFVSIKGRLYLTKEHLGNEEVQVEVESTLNGSCF